MKELKKNSPLLSLGQGINDLLRYKDIARAGQPVNFTGEGIVQLGALFSQMEVPFVDNAIKDLFKEKEEEKPATTETTKATETTVETPVTQEEINNDGIGDSVAKIKPVTQKNIKTYGMVAKDQGISTEQAQEDAVGWYGEQYEKNAEFKAAVDAAMKRTGASMREVFLRPSAYDVKKNVVTTDTYNGEYVPNTAIAFGKDSTAQSSTPFIGTTIIPAPTIRLSSSPFARLEQDHPKIFKNLTALKYDPNIMGDSPLRRIRHVVASPFLKTDQGPDLEKVDFRYMKRAVMPEYAKGRLGSAAAEGYNLAIDKHNYKAAVKKDFETEMTDQMGELVKGIDKTNPSYKRDLLGLVTEKKKAFADMFAKYSRGEISKLELENYKDSVSAELNYIQTSNMNVQKSLEHHLKNKDNIDFDASKPQIADYYNTIAKNPQAFTIKSIEGVDHYVGKTNGGEDLQIPVSMVADGTAQFRMVPKYDISIAANLALKAMSNIDVEGMTKFGFGKSNLSPNDPNLKRVAIAEIKNALANDESKLRSVMATKFQYDYDIFEQMLGDDKKANMQEMLEDAAEEIYKEDVLPRYFPESKTTRVDNSRLGFNNKNFSGSNSGGNAGATNAEKQVNSFFSDKSAWIRTNIGEGTLMEGSVLKIPGADGETYNFDLNRKEDIARLIRGYGSQAGGKGGDDFNLGVEEAIAARRSKRVSNSGSLKPKNKSNQDQLDPLGING